MANGLQVFIWRDYNGVKGYTRAWVADDTAASVLATALPDCSNAHLAAARGPLMTPDDYTAGTNAVYPGIADKTVWVFRADDQTVHRYETPAPVEAMFVSDDLVLDPTNPTVISVSSAFKAAAITPGGGSLTLFVGGFRSRRRLRTYPKVVVVTS